MDYFLYSGDIRRGADLQFIQKVSANKASNEVTVILATGGGNPDAAYKMGRYLQERYDDVSVFIPGFCKSAGTLFAMAANQLVFSPYGELGPLDVQMNKQDNLMNLESGLNISEAFASMEGRARDTFHLILNEIIQGSQGVVSFSSAAKAASDMVGSMYGPVFSQIDPEEVGSRSRAMRVGESYGLRLNAKFGNLKPGGMAAISQSYPSHGFAIDMREAANLFERVREATEAEKQIVEDLGNPCRFPSETLLIECITGSVAQPEEEDSHEKATGEAGKRDPEQSADDGTNPSRASKSKRATSSEGPNETSTAAE